MIALNRTSGSTYIPHYMAQSLQDIDFTLLAQKGVTHVAFDADSTLVPFAGKTIDEDTLQFLLKQKTLFNGWCIASNRITDDLDPIGESIGAHVIRAKGIARKPSRRFFTRVTSHFSGVAPAHIAMIGDKLRADIHGGNRMGFVTVWVEHIGHDGPLERLFFVRTLEKRTLERHLSR